MRDFSFTISSREIVIPIEASVRKLPARVTAISSTCPYRLVRAECAHSQIFRMCLRNETSPLFKNFTYAEIFCSAFRRVPSYVSPRPHPAGPGIAISRTGSFEGNRMCIWKRLTIVAAVLCAGVLLTGCGSGSSSGTKAKTTTSADGLATITQTSSGLVITPASISVTAGSQTIFTATGGSAPYSFSVFNTNVTGAAINATTGVFTASATAGTVNIMVQDASGGRGYAMVTIIGSAPAQGVLKEFYTPGTQTITNCPGRAPSEPPNVSVCTFGVSCLRSRMRNVFGSRLWRGMRVMIFSTYYQ